MNSVFWKIFVIMLLWPGSVFCQNDVDCKVRLRLDRLSGFELESHAIKDQIITFLILNESENNLNFARKYLAEKKNPYSPHLVSLFLNASIKNEDLSDDKLLEHLKYYKKKENDNAIPFYLLSCYFAQKKKYELSLQYLLEGNTKQICERYLKQKAEILIEYLLDQKEDELTAYYSQIRLYATNSFQIYRKLSQTLLKSSIKAFAVEEIFKLGVKLDDASYSIIDKLISNAIQFDAIKHSVDPNKDKLYDQLVIDRKVIMQLSNKVNEMSAEGKLMNYLYKMKEIGELGVLGTLLNF